MEVLFEKKGNIAWVTLNRENVLNVLNSNVINCLSRIFCDIETDGTVRAVVITGAGTKAFAAGADLKELRNAKDQRMLMVKRGQEVFSMIRHSGKPVIAAVNGYALGGGLELALSCDIRFASQNAKFALPEVKLGLIPGYGGTQLLSVILGAARAKHMMFTGDMISADEALKIGLIEKVCSRETLLPEVGYLAEKIAANGPLAVNAVKKAISGGAGFYLDRGLDHEFVQYAAIAFSNDAETGMDAFLNKTPPKFEGK